MKHEETADLPYLRKVVGASMAGTVVEWYEFFLYGTAATLVFGQLFFPNTGNELDGIIAAFATYAVGFIARPLGGIVFGHVGDKIGRKSLLQFSLVLIGASTFLMGCLPSFASIGYWAPALLVLLRFIQGFALGGEWGGAILLVTEHSPNRSRGFWGSFPQAAVPLGNLLATDRPADPVGDADRGGVPRLGLAGRLLAVGRDRGDRLLHPHPDQRFPDLQGAPRSGSRRRPRRATGWSRCSAAIRAACSPRWACGSARTSSITWWSPSRSPTSPMSASTPRASSTLLFVAHILHVFVHSAGRALAATGSDASRSISLGAALTMVWPFVAFPMLDSGDTLLILGAIMLGPGDPRHDVRRPAGADDRDVPDPGALFGRVARLSGDRYRRRLLGAADRHCAAARI